ncbi:hypothetical protein ABMA27_004010 [Loxostege sticticalis]|uniref:Uncharacterized protein n=1 Tax=Loxostege sticticalis TaxID=481309 RepID=A0ABR3HR53_LOXSC
MGKKKNKRFQNKPTTNPFWSNIGNQPAAPRPAVPGPAGPRPAGPRPAGPRPNLIHLKKTNIRLQTPHQFQAPHHQQDCVVDLTDDTSPNNPMKAQGNPGESNQGQKSLKSNPATDPIFETNEDVSFQDDVKFEEFDNKESNTKIDWQPNKIVDEPNEGVVQGSASDIKLVVQGSKSVTVATSSATGVNEKAKPTILASETITSKFSFNTAGPNLTLKGVQQPAVKVEETPKGKPSILGKKQINTRVTRDANPKPGPPQKFLLPTPPQPALPTNPVPQSSALQYNPGPGLLPLPTNPVPQSSALQYNPGPGLLPLPPHLLPLSSKQNYPNNPRPILTFHQNYPKGIPKSFLMNQTAETPEPYSNQTPAPESNPQWQPQKQTPTPNVIEYAYNYNPQTNQGYNESQPLYVNTEESTPVVKKQAYSPSDVYADNLLGTNVDSEEEVVSDGSQSPDLCEAGEKRLSAFKRLGPLTQPKKPKLTINLLCNKDQSVREVVDETEKEPEPKYVPVHLRPEITTSTDETVMKYLVFWPWKKPLAVRKTVTFRNSKSVMLMEHEQMVEIYDKNNVFIQVSVKGYPATWNKEQVLDTLLDVVNGKSFIPCFIEFAPEECKFLVIRSRASLTMFLKYNFIIHKEGHELHIAISQTCLTLNHIEFIPKLILKKRLVAGYSGERSLDLSDFTTKEDISHFIYFPLNRLNNQMDIVQQQTSISWEYLTEINLSHNRLTSIEGFNLPSTTPRLKFLDLSFNCIEKATLLLRCRSLALRTIKLEGNPLCNDYTDPSHYVKVLKLMFPTLVEIDGIPIKLPGEMPPFKKNYCPEGATELVEKFLEIYFPLLDSADENRELIRELYHERACMTITTRYKLRYGPIFKSFRSLFHRARVTDEGSLDSIDGAKDIAKLIAKWPSLKHDPFTFTVDVLMHDDFVTILKVGGLVRLTAETLAEDEHLLAFTRTFVLHSFDGAEYKIANELVYWDEPTEEYAHTAFQMTVKPKRLSLKLEANPDDDLKKKLVEIFMKLTEANESVSEKCLEQKEWNLKSALEYFMKLLKLDDLENLTKEIKV